MATVTSLNGGILPVATSFVTSSYSVDSIVTATADAFSWVTPSGDFFVLKGAFTYGVGSLPDGTIDKVDFDHGNDGSIDATVIFASSKTIPTDPSILIFGRDYDLLRFLFEDADTMDLNGVPDLNGGDDVFTADGSIAISSAPINIDNLAINSGGSFSGDLYTQTSDGQIFAGDIAVINTNAGAVELIGDLYRVGAFGSGAPGNEREMFFGADLLKDASTTGAVSHRLIGDLAITLTGTDYYILRFGADTLQGFENNVELIGDADVISGEDLFLYGGNDVITGGSGINTIYGDYRSFDSSANGNEVYCGNDSLVGGNNVSGDQVFGDVGDLGLSSTLYGGNDTIIGGAGGDLLVGEASIIGLGSIAYGGNDSIVGGSGNDTIIGDVLSTPPGGGGLVLGGDDTLAGGEGEDSISGGSGNDTLAGGLGDDTLNGEDGVDTVDYSASASAVNVALSGATPSVSTGEGTDLLSNIENVIGSAGDDTILGDAENNVLAGGQGADSLFGGTGLDTADYSTSSGGLNVNLITGFASGADATGDTLTAIENLTGSMHGDTLVGDGGGNVLAGGDGVDVLRGFGGNDVIRGDAGADDISGGNGSDTLEGGNDGDILRGQGQADTILAGGGDDEVSGGSGGDSILGGSGADSLLGQGQDDTIIGGADADTIVGGSGDDVLNGGTGADDLSGNGNNDTLRGGEDGDILRGAAGADLLEGDAGDDVLNGGDGGDRLDGGTGNDTMNGGGTDGARDTYVFAVGYDIDRVNGFDQLGTDRIELDDALWSATNPGLTAQQVVDTFGTLNGPGTILTLDFGGGDILEVQNAGGITHATLGSDILIV